MPAQLIHSMRLVRAIWLPLCCVDWKFNGFWTSNFSLANLKITFYCHKFLFSFSFLWSIQKLFVLKSNWTHITFFNFCQYKSYLHVSNYSIDVKFYSKYVLRYGGSFKNINAWIWMLFWAYLTDWWLIWAWWSLTRYWDLKFHLIMSTLLIAVT